MSDTFAADTRPPEPIWPPPSDLSNTRQNSSFVQRGFDCGHELLLPAPYQGQTQPSLAMLDKQDLDLFGHYLSHTCRTIPFDAADAYALQVGVPNLAFADQPLMSSILALAAACQCHDLLEAAAAAAATDDDEHPHPHPHPPTAATLDRVRDLLAAAEQHHRASLRQIREALPTTQRYDCVLASAALMVLYGSASHCVRIRVVELYKSARSGVAMPHVVPADMVPVQSQWISLIRAVHLAYVGLVADGAKNAAAAVGGQEVVALVENTMPCVVVTEPSVEAILCPQDGPTDDTRRLFLPIVASTSGSAMSKLRTRASRMGQASPSISSTDLQSCWEALEMLERTVDCVLSENSATSPTAEDDPFDTPEPLLPGVVAPWLRVYIARVTSNSKSSSSPLRRSVNAFLNRVPAAYVDLVQTTLDCVPPPEGGGISTTTTGNACLLQGEDLEVTVARRLAVDIFAHWLVLVLLLDGVWWIGETGSWELGRAVAFMRDRGGLQGMMDEEEGAWWPESMYKLRMELKKHAG